MSDMIEQVARAIGAKAIGADVWERMASPQRAMFRAQAIGAIEAMREPTEAMADAPTMQMFRDGDLWSVWRAMIDTALNTSTKG